MCIQSATSVLLFFVATAVCAAQADEKAKPKPLIPMTVTVAVEKERIESGSPIPIAVTIHNGLPGIIRYETCGLTPNGWNGETLTLSLVDIYRDDETKLLWVTRPKVAPDPPFSVNGVGSHQIKAGESLIIRTDARKWKVTDDWKPGSYRFNVRADVLDVDEGRCRLSVLSDFVEFEIE